MDITQIEASLKYGKLFDKKAMIFAYISVTVSIICFIFSICTLTLVEIIEELKWDEEMITICIVLPIFGLLLLGVCLNVIIKNNKHKRVIMRCFEDSIRTKAFVRRLDIVSLEYTPYQVQVDFEMDGEKFQRISAPGSFLGGYHKIFAKYDNKVKVSIRKHNRLLTM